MRVKELLKLSLEELTALEGRLWKEWQCANKAKELMQIMKEEEE